MKLHNVLIVDDSNAALKKLADLILTYGVQITAFNNASDALTSLNDGLTPDIIFMDHMMPIMDGLEATQLIKNNHRTQDIPVVMYTSKEGDSYLELIKSHGVYDLLLKPASNTDLEKIATGLGFTLALSGSKQKFDISKVNHLDSSPQEILSAAKDSASEAVLNLVPELIDAQVSSMHDRIEHEISEKVSQEIAAATQKIESMIIEKISQLDLVDYDTLKEQLQKLEDKFTKD